MWRGLASLLVLALILLGSGIATAKSSQSVVLIAVGTLCPRSDFQSPVTIVWLDDYHVQVIAIEES